MDATYCGECGAKLPSDKAKICIKCGAYPNSSSNFCTSCGEKLKSKKATFCINCGAPVSKNNFTLDNASNNYSLILYIVMILITLSSGIGGLVCSGPGIIIAFLFFLVDTNNKPLHNNAIVAAIIMFLHLVIYYMISIGAFILTITTGVGVVSYVLIIFEIIMVTLIYAYLAYRTSRNPEYTPIHIV